MSILDVNLSDREELKILPDNEEALLRITRAEVTPNKNDATRNNLALVFEATEDPMVDDIRMWIPIPTLSQQSEDPKRYTKALNRIADFFDALGVDGSAEASDLLGKEVWALMREEEGLDGNMQNSVRRFIRRK
jgi:hypothetical protein